MKYEVELSDVALDDIKALKKSGEIAALKKINALLAELEEHPYTGTGKPKPLGHGRTGQWSRHITEKHRLVYLVDDKKITVLVISASGHYDDK
ncbi:MAG: Txe/YoeB family addiction module toxin [Prevotellaceae bacterium]|jgi:toxin YoeB|nr:Txe/YoeB family addiction module toxin [Prevotellaceae bacterium]